jgi:hypothetical protein
MSHRLVREDLLLERPNEFRRIGGTAGWRNEFHLELS